jgi:exoribonuclease R
LGSKLTIQAITRKLRTRRVEAGALTSDEKLKVSFTLDESGKPVDVEKYERTDAHSMVEEVGYQSSNGQGTKGTADIFS